MVVVKLNDAELLNIKGGSKGLFYSIALGVGGILALITGIIDGYLNPIKCR